MKTTSCLVLFTLALSAVIQWQAAAGQGSPTTTLNAVPQESTSSVSTTSPGAIAISISPRNFGLNGQSKITVDSSEPQVWTWEASSLSLLPDTFHVVGTVAQLNPVVVNATLVRPGVSLNGGRFTPAADGTFSLKPKSAVVTVAEIYGTYLNSNFTVNSVSQRVATNQLPLINGQLTVEGGTLFLYATTFFSIPYQELVTVMNASNIPGGADGSLNFAIALSARGLLPVAPGGEATDLPPTPPMYEDFAKEEDPFAGM